MARRGQETPNGAAGGLGFPLSEVAVRPVRDAVERATWDRVMDKGHYLGFRGMFGDGLRHVAVGPDGRWLVLLGWCAGAFKVGARDAWIGWAAEQQFRRLGLVANNCRFLVLPSARVPNLASRVLALSVRRVSGDMQARFGHPVWLAETFVDPSRFRGACYRAAGWTLVGSTRGIRHSLASVLAIAVAARLAGIQGPTAIAEYGARLNQRQLAAVQAFRSPTTGRRALHRAPARTVPLPAPGPSTLRRSTGRSPARNRPADLTPRTEHAPDTAPVRPRPAGCGLDGQYAVQSSRQAPFQRSMDGLKEPSTPLPESRHPLVPVNTLRPV